MPSGRRDGHYSAGDHRLENGRVLNVFVHTRVAVQGATIVDMLIDVDGFWRYDNRETLSTDDDQADDDAAAAAVPALAHDTPRTHVAV